MLNYKNLLFIARDETEEKNVCFLNEVILHFFYPFCFNN